MTLNEQLTITSLSVLDSLIEAQEPLIDADAFLRLIDVFINVCAIQTGTIDYIPCNRNATQHENADDEVVATMLTYGAALTEKQLLQYMNTVSRICNEDSRIRNAFRDFYGSDVSFHDQLAYAERDFGANAMKLMRFVFNMK